MSYGSNQLWIAHYMIFSTYIDTTHIEYHHQVTDLLYATMTLIIMGATYYTILYSTYIYI
jgi:hypothetical protein